MKALSLSLAAFASFLTIQAQADEANLVRNGDFSGGTRDWLLAAAWRDKPISERVTIQKLEDGNAARFEASEEELGGLQQLVELTPTDEASAYRVFFKARLGSSTGLPRGYKNGSISFGAKYSDGSEKWEVIPEGFLNPDSLDWQEIDFIWTPQKPLSSFHIRLMPPPNTDMEVAVIKITPIK